MISKNKWASLSSASTNPSRMITLKSIIMWKNWREKSKKRMDIWLEIKYWKLWLDFMLEMKKPGTFNRLNASRIGSIIWILRRLKWFATLQPLRKSSNSWEITFIWLSKIGRMRSNMLLSSSKLDRWCRQEMASSITWPTWGIPCDSYYNYYDKLMRSNDASGNWKSLCKSFDVFCQLGYLWILKFRLQSFFEVFYLDSLGFLIDSIDYLSWPF